MTTSPLCSLALTLALRRALSQLCLSRRSVQQMCHGDTTVVRGRRGVGVNRPRRSASVCEPPHLDTRRRVLLASAFAHVLGQG